MTWTRKKADPEKMLCDYDRGMLRSAFVSLFWAVIQHRRKTGRLTLQDIADGVGTNRSAVSRWFGGEPPNWTLNTIADISRTLDLELRIEAVDRATGEVFSPSGMVRKPVRPREQPAIEGGGDALTGTRDRLHNEGG